MADLLSFDIGLDLDRKPAVGFNFVLRVEALYDLPCKSIRSFSKANEYEYVQEGGVNDYVHMLRKPISQPFTFQVERYVGVNLLDPLANGTDLILPVILMVNRTYGDSQTVRYYIFTGCTVTAKEFGELDSEKSGLLTETTTIAYREMFCIDNPLAGLVTGKTWSFDGTSKAGSGTRSARHIDDAVKGGLEAEQSEMEAKAKKWLFTGGDTARAGNEISVNQQSAVSVVGQLSRDAMEQKARRWPREKSAASIASYLSDH